MPRGLPSLSPELLINILQFLSSSRDLYTILRASSQFYRVFAEYKSSILFAVLLHAIPQEVEADFILAQLAQRIWKLTPEHNKRHRFLNYRYARDGELFGNLNEESLAILDRFKSKNGEHLYQTISDRTILLDAWKLYSNFEHFMISYSTRALLNLRQSFYSSETYSSEKPLSFIERTRLQRAFFRWEIYTCLFQISHVFCDDIRFSAPSTDPASKFSAMLPPWEVEEISCVAQFYKLLMEELSDRIEEDFVIMTKKKMNAREMKDEDDVDDMMDLDTVLWYDESFKSNNRSRHIDYLISRGMLCLRKLTSAPFPIVRRMVARSDLEAKNKIPMLDGLQKESSPRAETEEYYEGELVELSEKNDSDDEGLENCNFGWRWAVGHMTTCRLYAPANYELRNRGYVFWSKERLLESQEFQKSSRDSVNDFFIFPPGYQEHSERPGVETKLKGFPVHWEVVEEISNEIDGDDDDVDFAVDWKI